VRGAREGKEAEEGSGRGRGGIDRLSRKAEVVADISYIIASLIASSGKELSKMWL